MSTYNSIPSKVVNSKSPIKLNEILNLKHLALGLFNLFVKMSNIYVEVCPSREWLAKQLKCHPHHIDKLIKYLVSIGAIVKIKRAFKVTNLYKLNDIFYLAEIRDQLADLCDGFKTWGMASLMRAKAFFRKNASLLYKSLIFNNINDWSSEDDLRLIKKISKKENPASLNLTSNVNSSERSSENYNIFLKEGKNNKKQLFRAGQFTPGFNSNYHFPRSEREFALERAEFYIENSFAPFSDKTIKSAIHEVQARKNVELQRKQEQIRQESLKPKQYSQEQLAEMKKVSENNKQKRGNTAFFANFLEKIQCTAN